MNMDSGISIKRKIIHIDMDAFYASIEQLDNPHLRGKPVAVGGSRERGVVAAASYEARKFGVHSAMPSIRAAKLCPQITFVKPRFARYKELSQVIKGIFQEYTDLIEPLSLDEAYLDVTHCKKDILSATLIAKDIKRAIKSSTGLYASAGISYCKFLAKIASDMDKPNGLYVIPPEDAFDFLTHLPIKKFHGIGKVTAEKMKQIGIFTGADLRKLSLADLNQRYGKSGQYFYNIVRGIDERAIIPERTIKSVSAERTFDKDLMKLSEIYDRLDPIIEEVIKRYQTKSVKGKTIILKVKYGDFRQITRSTTLEKPVESKQDLIEASQKLFNQSLIDEAGVRLLGIGISNFVEETNIDHQLTIQY
jgi:DNA polymerase-4